MNEALLFGNLPVPAGALGVLALGQAGFFFTTGAGVLCVDPYLSNCVEKLVGPEARRMWWNGFRVDELRPDALLITHDHLDHLDPETLPVWEQIAPPAAYFGPPTVLDHLRQLRFRPAALVPFARGAEAEWGGMRLKAVYAEHTEDSIGFTLSVGDLRVYVTGDTCPNEALVNEETLGCDVLIACVNGIDENLSPAEAVALARRLGAKKLIPMHYGLIPCSTVSARAFMEAAGELACPLPAETAWMLDKFGGSVRARRCSL